MVKWNAAEIQAFISLAWMVGDDRRGDHRQIAGSPPVENINQAMIEFGHHQQDAMVRGAITDLPDDIEWLCNNAEAGLKRRQFCRRARRVEHYPHEKLAGLDVAVLLGIENVLPIGEQECRDGGDDARTVWAGQSQYELLLGHEEPLQGRVA